MNFDNIMEYLTAHNCPNYDKQISFDGRSEEERATVDEWQRCPGVQHEQPERRQPDTVRGHSRLVKDEQQCQNSHRRNRVVEKIP